MAKQPMNEADAAKQKLVDESTKAKEQSVKEQAERHGRARPTPTQAEMDQIAVGINVDEKEDDGGEDEQEVLHRQMAARVGVPYETRDAKPAAKPAQQPQPQPQRRDEK